MKVINKKKKMVRILIGETETGKSGISKPIFVILVDEESSKKVYEFVKEALK